MFDAIIFSFTERHIRHETDLVRKIVEELALPKKLDFLKEALQRSLPNHKHAIAEFISECHSARTERDDITHRLWASTESPAVKVLIDETFRGKRKERRVTAASMMALATRLIDLGWELADWSALAFQPQYLQLIQRAASLGMPTPPDLPTTPPRVSAKDARENKQRRQDRQPGPSQH